MSVKQKWQELEEQLDRAYPACDLVRLSHFLEEHSDWAVAHFEHADILREFRRFREARQALKVAQSLLDRPFFLLKVSQGQTYYDAGHLGLALRYFQSALQLEPTEVEPHLWLARCWRHQGRLQQAGECLRQLRRRAGDFRGEVALERGYVLRAQENWGQALRWFRRAAQEGETREAEAAISDLLEAHQVDDWNEHDLQYRHGGPVTELSAGRRLHKLQPDWLCPIARQATALADLGRLREALVQVEHYQKLSKGHPLGMRLKAMVLHACKRYATSARLYLKIAARAKDTGPWIFAGCCLARLGELDMAEHCHRQATTRIGDPDEAWFNLALVLRAQGRYVEALECARQAAQLDPQYDGPVLLGLKKAVELSGKLMRPRALGDP